MADLSGPPPPRWRVVERDRKLVVIDTETGETATRHRVEPGPASGLSTWFDGPTELNTHPWYDDNGPRTIRLGSGSAATIRRLKQAAIGLVLIVLFIAFTKPWLLLPAFALFDQRLRARLRRAATGWLDRVAREAG